MPQLCEKSLGLSQKLQKKTYMGNEKIKEELLN